MHRFYEKVKESEENPYGMKPIEENENPLKNGPCLISILAIVEWESSVNAALNFGIQALRLNSKHNQESQIDLETFGGRVLSIAYGEPNPDEVSDRHGRKMKRESLLKKMDEDFIKKYFYTLIEENENRLDITKAMKNVRNVNFLSFCNSTSFILTMQELLAKRMKQLGYNEQETEQILSQMCVIGYLSDIVAWKRIHKEKTFGTNISCIDVNDKELTIPDQVLEYVNEKKIVCDDDGFFLIAGEGTHRPSRVFYEMSDVLLGISAAATTAMSNSIKNNQSEQFIPLNIQEILDKFDTIAEQKKKGIPNTEIMAGIEQKIQYSNNRDNSAEEYSIGNGSKDER